MNIVQIGSNKGNDDLTPIVKEYSEIITNLILVEPLSVHFTSLKECYKDTKHIIEQAAITDDESVKELTFFYHKEDGPGYEVASLNKEHILKHVIYNPKLTIDGIVEELVPCYTINTLLDKHDLLDIDILFIDAEGFDDKLIKSINFGKYNIINIIYENLHINNDDTISYLNSKGYNIDKNWGSNGWSSLAVKS